jgi:hypothetical protein
MDDAKFATAKALKDSHNVSSVVPSTAGKVLTSDGTDWISSALPTIPVKAIGSELDTGTDDAKFATAKAIKDSHNVPSVVPGMVGHLLTSDGTDWISAAPGAGGGDVVGPAGAINGNLAVFDTTTGKLIKDGGPPAGGGDVHGDASATDGHLALFDTDGYHIKDGGAVPAGGGDVVGPAGATDGHLAVFDMATGKLIKDGGVVPAGGGSPAMAIYLCSNFT